MSKKLTYDYVYDFFKEKNCELLEESYKNNSTKMKFRCSCGNIDEKSYARFSKAPNCTECSSENSLKQLKPAKIFSYDEVKKFIENNSNCSLLSTTYKRNDEKLNFLCDCGEIFSASFAKFKDRNKRQCNTCSTTAIKNKLKFSYEEAKSFVENESECKLISETYINNSKPLSFLCKCGENFSVSFAKFKDKNQRQCYSCGQKLKIDQHKLDIEEVKRILEENGCELMSTVYINMKSPIIIKCECGELFSTILDTFKRENGKKKCDSCVNRQSALSSIVENFLKDNNIFYRKEYRIDDCRNINPLPFDYAVLNHKSELRGLIEVDGQQHFKPVPIFGGEEKFLEQQKRDKIKNDYCKENKINLLRIPYFEVKNIEKILREHLSLLGVLL